MLFPFLIFMKNELVCTDFFHQNFPENKNPVFVAASPGRMDVMGGIADYSGSLVLQMPIAEKTMVALAFNNSDKLCVKTSNENVISSFSIDYSHLLNENVIDYDFAHRKLTQMPDGDWAIYVIGCLLVLAKEKQLDVQGLDIFIDSAIPLGKGVSSSAALEVATLKALAAAFNIDFQRTELPILAQKAENHVVKAPCGLMDQLASYFGVRGKLLPILCQPDILYPL
ncbi:MAG: GHMP kinase, partial [Verrucomicrobia bacterium]|nr:GHMP kinase [Cytophagales bacterium]